MSSSDIDRTFTIASRASKLAQIQTNSVLAALESHYPPSASNVPRFKTKFSSNEEGDVNKISAIYLLGGKSLWTKGLETSLVSKDVDMLVHSFKDVPTELPPGCIIAGVMEREDPSDSLLIKQGTSYKSLDDLPHGAIVGTGSVRRVAQLQRKYPHLKFEGLRGNIDTRISKLHSPDSPYSAIILAKSGLIRANLAHHITQVLSPPTLLHAVSQGALAIEVRSDDHEAIALCDQITHWQTKWCCFAERALLRVLEGGCSVPVGVSSSILEQKGEWSLRLQGCVTSIDGLKHVEHTLEQTVGSLEEAEAVGKSLATILIDTGAKEILDEINLDRAGRVGDLKTEKEVQKIEEALEPSVAQ